MSNDTPRANNDSRAGAAQQLAHHWRANARDMRAEGPEYGTYADALESCAKALLSVFHVDVDLISSAARQTYIESGVWPTRTEIAEHSTEAAQTEADAKLCPHGSRVSQGHECGESRCAYGWSAASRAKGAKTCACGATYDETRDLLVSPAGHADVVAALADEADDDDEDITESDLDAARALFADLEV